MTTWREIAMGQLLRVEHGFAFKSDHFAEAGNFIVLTPGNFYESGGFKARPDKDRFYQGRFPERYLLKKDDLIVAMTEQGEGLLGSAAFIPESNTYLHNQRLGLVRMKSDTADKRFVYYLFNSNYVRQQIRNSSSGAKVRHTSPERIYRVKVLAPDRECQRKIGAVLSSYDELIENNKQSIALLEKLVEEMYREWFVRLRFPGHEGVRKVKGLPVGWTPTPSSKVFRVMSGGTPHTDNPVYWSGDIPFFTPKDASDNFYVLRTERTITQKGLDSCNSRLYKKNTIFITARGTVGKLCLTFCEMAMNQTCYALSPILGGDVYFHFLSMKNAVTYIKGVSKSGVFDNIIVDTFNIIPLFMPPDSLILRFNEFAAPVFKQIGALLHSNSLLEEARDILLSRLMSGKLSVENLDIQFPPGMTNQSKAEPEAAAHA